MEDTLSMSQKLPMAVQGFMDWRGNPINKERHGGVRAAMFIYFMVVMTNMAYVPIMMNLVTYLHGTMHMDVASSSTAVTNFIGVTCAFSLLGAFISDAYISRFKSILIFGPLEFLGFGLLALQAHIQSLRPPGCDISIQLNNCKQVDGFNAILLYIAMYTLALGEGFLRSNLASLGGDQFDDEDPIELQLKTSFFNWFTFGISLGVSIGLILVVWIESNKGWDYGFSLSAFIILLGLLVVGSGFPFYRNLKPSGSPLTRMLRVCVAAFRKRELALPENVEEVQKELAKEDTANTELLLHTKGFKFLDKALIFRAHAGDWSNCTVTQVEETKIFLRLLPIFITSVVSYIPIPLLLTLTVQQGTTMKTKLGNIHISPATLMVVPAAFQMVILVFYDRLFVPFARKITGYAGGITQLQRVGIGFLSISLASSVAALIESKRRKTAAEHGVLDSGAEVPMSVLWLVVQCFILGIMDVTAFVGLLEFFNTEISRGMKSIGTALFWCVTGFASLLGSVLIDAVNTATRHNEDGRMGWVEGNNLNQGHLDYFYWLLSVLGFVGFLNYLFWANKYVYRQNPHIAKL